MRISMNESTARKQQVYSYFKDQNQVVFFQSEDGTQPLNVRAVLTLISHIPDCNNLPD